MRVATIAAAFAGVASAQWAGQGSWGPPSNSSDVYVTEVVTAFTTYCPEATALTHNGITYTVSSATTLTITNCPCTVTKPVTSSVVTSCTTCSTPVGTAPVSVAPVSKPKPSGTAPGASGVAPSGTGVWSSPSASSSPITPSKGAASQLQAGAAAVLAVFGLVAAL